MLSMKSIRSSKRGRIISHSTTGVASTSSKQRGKLRQFLDFRLPETDLNRSIEEFYIALDTPVSLSCLILFRHGEYRQLVEKEICPIDYIDRFRFRDDYSAISFLRKNKIFKTGLRLDEIAISAFKSSETQCRITNQRFRNLALDPAFTGSNVWLLNATQRKIAWILGSFDGEELFDSGSWGPGVTTLVKGTDVSASRKFRDERGVTKEAYRLLGTLMREAYPSWDTSLIEYQAGNRVITVPKNAKTDRTIAIEPGLNSWFQLGIGRMIRRRLGRVGFDLNSDVKNQSSARIGSLTNVLATVDFSAASDTISKELVRELLPPDWFLVLDAIRSPCYELGGQFSVYEKFSAMGNGFTFELESLIFVAAALAVCEYIGADTDPVSIFGDDVIIPSSAYPLYSSFSSFLGFTINPSKSYSDGLFRESCGAYYFDGLDVKPLFLKETVKDAKALYRLVNSIRALAHRRNLNCGCDARLLPVWKSLHRRIPKQILCSGPVSAGDSAIHVNFDEGCPVIAGRQWCGYLHPGFQTIPQTRYDEHSSLLLASLWRSSRENPHGNEVSLRGVTKVRFKPRIFTSQWYNFGPWY